MKCDEFREKIFDYYENELDETDKKSFEEHLNTCPQCKSEYDAYKKLIDNLNDLPDEQLPTGYCKKLHKKLEDVNKQKIKRHKRNNLIKYIGIAAAFVLVVTSVYFAGMLSVNFNSSKDFSMNMSDAKVNEESYDSIAPQSFDTNGSDNGFTDKKSDQQFANNTMSITSEQDTDNQRAYADKIVKIIKDGDLSLDTTEFDALIADLEQYMDANNGYIEYNQTNVYKNSGDKEYRTADLKLRIPQEKFDDLVQYIMSKAKVNSKTINETDVTKNYYDTKNIVTNLEAQETRLRELYKQATTVDEIIQLETEITRVRTEIDSYNLYLNDIDDRVSMASLEVYVNEVDNSFNISSSNNMWEKAKDGFINSINMIIAFIQGFIVAIISYFPILLIIAIIVFVIYKIIKKKKTKVK